MDSKSKLTFVAVLLMSIGLAFPCFNAWAEGEPYFEYCIVQSVNTVDGMRTQLCARVFDSNGMVPQTINTFNVTGPGGFAYSFTGDDYDALSNVYWQAIQGQPVEGEYTFTVTDNEGKTAVSYSYLTVGDTIPLPDPSSLQASGDPLSPTLSWGAVAGYEGNLFYWAAVYDLQDNIIWISGITNTTSVYVPGGILVGGESYQWGVNVFDNYHYFASSNCALSQIVDLTIDNSRPYFVEAAVYNRLRTVDILTIASTIVVDPNGILPDSITSLTVTGPGGFSYAFQPEDYDPVVGEYYGRIQGRPADGVYAFTATDNEDKTAVSHDYVEVQDVPLVDANSYQASGDPLAPTLSWGAPAGMDQSLYFRAEIYDTEEPANRIWGSGRHPRTSVTVDPGILQPGVSYRWRMKAEDDERFIHYDNRSDSEWVDLVIDNSRPYFDFAHVYNHHAPDGFYTVVNTRVVDPNGILPGSITSLIVTGPGGFSYAFQPEDYNPVGGAWYARIQGRPADGVYAFTVTDNEDKTAVSHDYVEVGIDIPIMDESTFLVSGNPLAPTISWSAISGYQGHLHYRLKVEDTEGNEIYSSSREPTTSQTIPGGMIQNGKSYLFRVESFDHKNWIIYNNRSNSGWVPITMEPGIAIRGKVLDLSLVPIDEIGVEGINVSMATPPDYTSIMDTSGLNGDYELENVPSDTDYISILCEGDEGYVNTYTAFFKTGDVDIEENVYITPQEFYDVIDEGFGVTQQAGKGVIVGAVLDPDLGGKAGAKVSTTPSYGVFYFGEDGIPDPTRTETSSNGLFIIFNVDAGDVEVTATMSPDFATTKARAYADSVTVAPVAEVAEAPAGPAGDGGGGGCSVATAAFGSPLESHVKTLRDFRDRYLLTNSLGRVFVSFYYKYSPPIADFIAKHPMVRKIVRIGLYPMLGLSKWFMGEDPSK